MGTKEQSNLIAYGRSVGVIVEPVELAGVRGVSIEGITVFSEQQAHSTLLSMTLRRCA